MVYGDCGTDAEACFENLRIPGTATSSYVSFDEASSPNLDGRAYASVDSWNVIIDPTMFFDLVEDPSEKPQSVWPNNLESRFELNRYDVIGILLDGASGTYGFTRHERGVRVRCWLIQGETLILDEGTPARMESEIFQAVGDPEQALLRILFQSSVDLERVRNTRFQIIAIR